MPEGSSRAAAALPPEIDDAGEPVEREEAAPGEAFGSLADRLRGALGQKHSR